MAAWVIAERFTTSANVDVLGFLRLANPSAHSDVAEELVRAGASVAAIRPYCPAPARYAFVILHLQDQTIVGLAYGMSSLAFRLPDSMISEALRDGGALAAELGPGWVRFPPWTDHETLAESRGRLSRWCGVAAGQPAV